MSSISLLELQQRVGRLVADPSTQNVWVTAELSDVNVRGGHCYMELLQKNDRGVAVAKARGVIWASHFPRIDAEFFNATGQRFATGLKVLLRVSASLHPVYGFSLTINAVDPSYTLGDLMRRRQEILDRLKKEGILELNRQLEVPELVQRIAVVSAPGAAGYGDFINQLFSNTQRLRFDVRLFPAVMQGTAAPKSIIEALETIAEQQDEWDIVVIVRGGGATSDLQAFEDYALAANVAQFPLPILIGIGHERDVTVLDYIANTRVKTPTAAAEWLIAHALEQLNRISLLANQILQLASDRVAGAKEQIAFAEGNLPSVARASITRAQARLHSRSLLLGGISGRRIAPAIERLRSFRHLLVAASAATVARARQTLDARAQLLDALSPQATLRRGYTITRVDGHAVGSAASLRPGAVISTTFADGEVRSTVVPDGPPA